MKKKKWKREKRSGERYGDEQEGDGTHREAESEASDRRDCRTTSGGRDLVTTLYLATVGTLPCLNLNLPWLTSYARPCAFLEKAGTSCQLTFYFIQEILRNWHYLIRLAVSSETATAPPGRKDSFFPLSLLLLD